MADRVGKQLGNYRLLRPLGRGGFAEVYLGEHTYLGTYAAIKLLYTRVAESDIAQFQGEARILANLIHPHIVRVLEFGIDDHTPYLVMDYAPGSTLRTRHPKGTRVSVPTVVTYVKQIAQALQYAHDQKLIHRDIKPENMLIGRNGDLLLSDFGIALIAQSSRYQSTKDMAGTITYMAPEQIEAHPRPASDQYSLGIVVYEWLSGNRPFHGSFTEVAVKHTLTAPPSLLQQLPTLSPDIEQIVFTALAKKPENRFGSVHAFATALEQASLDAPAVSAHPQASQLFPQSSVSVLPIMQSTITHPSQPSPEHSEQIILPPQFAQPSTVEDTPSIETVPLSSPIPPINQKASTSRWSLQTSPWRTDIRILLISAMIVFLITVAIGLLDGQHIVTLSTDVLLTHVHAGTIGWITLSVFAISIWVFGEGAPRGTNHYIRWSSIIAAISVPLYVLAFLSGIPMALAVLGVPVLLVMVAFLSWVVARISKTRIGVAQIAILASLLTLVLAGLLGVLLQFQSANDTTFLPDGAGGAHPVTMVAGYLALIGIALSELSLQPDSQKVSWAGIIQVMLFFLAGLALGIGILFDLMPPLYEEIYMVLLLIAHHSRILGGNNRIMVIF
jgi:serine/threonine protein kinase